MVVVDMQSRIESELKGQEISKIKELNLDNSKAAAINGLTSEFVELETLSLKNMGLTSLKGFPALPKLRSLELNDNCISDGLENLLVCPNLTHLNLSGNKLNQLDALRPLTQLANLTHLKLHNGEIEMKEDYRDEVFKLLGNNLKYLDGFDVNEQEEDDEDYSDESDEDDDDDDEEEEEEGEEEKSEPGLSYLQKSNLAEEEESDDEEFDVEKAEKKEQDEAMDTEMSDEKQPAGKEGDENDIDEDEEDESESDGEPGVSYLLKSNLAEEEPDDEEFDVEKEMEKEPSNGEEDIDEEYENGDDAEEEIHDQDDEISQDNILDEACSRRKRNDKDALRQVDSKASKIEKQL